MKTPSSRILTISAVAGAFCLCIAVDTANAELSVLAGLTMSGPRAVLGLAASGCRGAGCWELEYARTLEDAGSRTPASDTFGVSFMVRLNSRVERIRYFGIGGIGIYDEVGEYSDSGGAQSANLGGGAFIALNARLKLRLEYRLFFPGSPDGGEFVQRHPQRLSVGLTVAFR